MTTVRARLVTYCWVLGIFLALEVPTLRASAASGTAAASAAVILNAAWVVKLHHLSDLAEQLGVTRAEIANLQEMSRVNDVLDRLTLKSMDIASNMES